MPNDCENSATFQHGDAAQIRKVVEAFNAGNLFSAFVPQPSRPEDGHIDLGAWRCEHWGTKWDVGADDYNEPVAATDDATAVTARFYSAWTPPLSFYAAMEAQGFAVEAYYYEPGFAFCGIYEEGEDDRFDIRRGSAWARKHLPAILNEKMGISARMEEMEAEDTAKTDG